MIEAAAANGWIDRDRAIVESLTGDPPGRRADRADLLGGRGRRPVSVAPAKRMFSVTSTHRPEPMRSSAALFDRAPRR